MTTQTASLDLASLLRAFIARRLLTSSHLFYSKALKSTVRTADEIFQTIFKDATTFCHADSSSLPEARWRCHAVKEHLDNLHSTHQNKQDFRITLSHIFNIILSQFSGSYFTSSLNEEPTSECIMAIPKGSFINKDTWNRPKLQPDIILTSTSSIISQREFSNFQHEDWNIFSRSEGRSQLHCKDVLCSILVKSDGKDWNNPIDPMHQKIARNTLNFANHYLRHRWNVTHSLVLQIRGPSLVLIFQDTQGVIHTEPIHIVHDLPLVVTMLITFQRFNPTAWGIPNILLSCEQNGVPRAFCLDTSKARIGKHTYTAPVDWVDKEPSAFPNAFFKAYWSEDTRKKEPHIINEARFRADKNLPVALKCQVLDHIPTVLGWKELPETSTELIRQIFILHNPQTTWTSSQEPSRSLVWMVFPMLTPVENLKEAPFLNAFLDMLICHFLLWQLGIVHGDVSLDELMIDPVTKKGILNDFDLASIMKPGDQSPPKQGSERTGTLPFMAYDLLCASHGSIQRQYHHDLESFAWCLFWHYSTLSKGDLYTKCPSIETARMFKGDIFGNGDLKAAGYNPSTEFTEIWNFLRQWMKFWADETMVKPIFKPTTSKLFVGRLRRPNVNAQAVPPPVASIEKGYKYYLDAMFDAFKKGGMGIMKDLGWSEFRGKGDMLVGAQGYRDLES